ncbi:hypothetical protein GCM10027075_24850 [Streptomyces heilongjiangensis]|nr:hypothetical protein [Streptomyces heilongjiangensis]MDC2951400.1 hypothetical protein [Streptomyces heilongjiangensis]
MGAVLALTTAADLPERVRRVAAVTAYDSRCGIARSGLLARAVVGGALLPGAGRVTTGVEPRPALGPGGPGGPGGPSGVTATAHPATP